MKTKKCAVSWCKDFAAWEGQALLCSAHSSAWLDSPEGGRVQQHGGFFDGMNRDYVRSMITDFVTRVSSEGAP